MGFEILSAELVAIIPVVSVDLKLGHISDHTNIHY